MLLLVLSVATYKILNSLFILHFTLHQKRFLFFFMCIFRAAVKLIEDESVFPYIPRPYPCTLFPIMLSEQSSTFITMDEPVLPLLDALVIFCCCDKIP